MPVAHCQALCWVLQIQGRCGPLIVELAVFRNQERKCYVDKAREKCEGIRTHLLWLISLPGKGGEGLSSVSGFAWWRAELGIGAESQHGLSCPAVTVSTRVTGARKGQVFFLTFLVPIRVRLELCFMSSHSHVARWPPPGISV